MVTTSQPPPSSVEKRSKSRTPARRRDSDRKRAERQWLREILGDQGFQLTRSREQRRRRYAGVACLLEKPDGRVFALGLDGLWRVTLGPAQLRASGLRFGRPVPSEIAEALDLHGAVQNTLAHEPLPPIGSIGFRAHVISLWLYVWNELRTDRRHPRLLRRYLRLLQESLGTSPDVALDNPLRFLASLAILGWFWGHKDKESEYRLTKLGVGVLTQLVALPGITACHVSGELAGGRVGGVLSIPIPESSNHFSLFLPAL